MTVFYAVGDIHGRDDLLEQLIGHIRDHHALLHDDEDGELICLGDYVDGGLHSMAVIDRLMNGIEGFRTTCLLGNHEAMLLECTETDNRQAWYTWLSNGGEETLHSLGVSLRFGGYDPVELTTALGPERLKWLKTLSLFERRGSYLFVHAGIAPGVPIERQAAKDLLWIRGRFLESDADHGFVVVHGHTPGDEPVVKPNRICLDTGATSNGILSAAVLANDIPPIFLRATGQAGKG